MAARGTQVPGRSRRRLIAAAVVTAGLGTTVAPVSPASGQEPGPPFEHDDTAGVDVRGTPEMVDLDGAGGSGPDPRLWDVEMVTPSVFATGSEPPPPAVDPVQIPLRTRIYLPVGYDHDRAAGYPVLYLLHGGAGTSRDWSRPGDEPGDSCGAGLGVGGGDIVGTLDGTPFPGITVMVEGGCAGWYADWHGETDGHLSPQWETFHTAQLVPWIDANLNTDASRDGRSIAGLSMGGLGALRYAARHPDLFSAVGSFSGATEMRYEPFQDTVSNSMWAYGATVDQQGLLQTEYRVTTGEPPEVEETSRLRTVFGPESPPSPPETRPGWPALNPVELAEAGGYGPYDGHIALYSGTSVNWWDGGEGDIATMNDALHDALAGSGVTHRYCRGFGTHDWEYWRNDLRDFLHHVYGATPSTCTQNEGWEPAT